MKAVLRVAEIVLVSAAIAVLTIKGTQSDAYEAYVKQGGTRPFWSWVTKRADALQAEIDEQKAAKKAAFLAKKDIAAKQAAAKAEAERIAMLEKKAAELREKLRRSDAEAQKIAATHHKKHANNAKHRGGSVKTGGKSSYVAGNGKTPYRVNGIQGIEFGSSDNAPGKNVKPVLGVAYDDEGNMHFRRLIWRENKPLTDPVYGFDKAFLYHSIDSEQLSTVTFNKNFPFTEQGLKDAQAFYEKMSGEAAADLGFEPVTKDRTDNFKSSNICGFTNKGGDTTISGGIQVWSDNHVTVTLNVTDNACSAQTASQSQAAYESGLADAIDAHVEVWNQDRTEQKQRVKQLLGK